MQTTDSSARGEAGTGQQPTGRMLRRLRFLPLWIVAGCWIVLCTVINSPLLLHYLLRRLFGRVIHQPRPFTSPDWKNSTEQGANRGERLRMVQDLLKRRILAGKNRQEIIDLLGSPSHEYGTTLEFPLGEGRYYRIWGQFTPFEFFCLVPPPIAWYMYLVQELFVRRGSKYLSISHDERGIFREATVREA